MGNVSQTHIGSTKQVVTLPFHQWEIPDANGTLYAASNTNGTLLEYTMPTGGSVLGITGSLTEALSSGTLQFQPRIDGSLCPVLGDGSNALQDLSNTAFHFLQPGRKDNYTFAAGASIGVNLVKSGTVSPTTADGSYLLVVLLEGLDY